MSDQEDNKEDRQFEEEDHVEDQDKDEDHDLHKELQSEVVHQDQKVNLISKEDSMRVSASEIPTTNTDGTITSKNPAKKRLKTKIEKIEIKEEAEEV